MGGICKISSLAWGELDASVSRPLIVFREFPVLSGNISRFVKNRGDAESQCRPMRET